VGRTSDIYSAYERQVAQVLKPVTLTVARTRILLVGGWWLLRQQHSRAELVELGLTTRVTSYRHEGHAEELFGKPVDDMTAEDMAVWVKALTTATVRR
jgi:hypothetical protein